jgi:PAS domain S-box-containing protein
MITREVDTPLHAIGNLDVALLRETERRLQESEERLRLAVAAGDIGIWDYFPRTGALFWDDRCKQIHGAAPDARVTYELFSASVHPHDRRRVDELVNRMLDPANGDHYVAEYRIVGLTRHLERSVSVRGKVLFNEFGQAVRFIGTTQDITEEKRIGETRERLLGIVGHDLRGPLSAIKSAVGLLNRRAAHPPDHLAMMIARSVERMAAMISALLEFTRVRLGGGITLERETIHLGDLARQIVDEVALAHGGRRPHLRTLGDCVGSWDRTRMGQVLANLLHNALIHGSSELPVSITVRGERAEVICEVHNEGLPIRDELLPVLFDPFRQGETAERRQGLGLGLYIANEIVVAHGGNIEVLSTADAGTTFTVRIPRSAKVDGEGS